MSRKITLIEGDGIGPEVVGAAKEILSILDPSIGFEEKLIGLRAIEECGAVLPDDTINSIKKNKVALKGPTTTPIGVGHKSANVSLRKALDLYACIRPVKTINGLENRFENIDLVIFRENTEGLYAGHEFELAPGMVIALRTITQNASKRIAKKAFLYAKEKNIKKVTAVHKANILKMSDGLFLNSIRKELESFSGIEYDECIVDALCMKLTMKPESFGVLILENMFGDIVSDLCAGLVGGLGVVPGANIGDEFAVFEAVHGTAPDIAGQDLANPTGILFSAAMMLDYLGKKVESHRLKSALYRVLEQKPLRTRDLGGSVGTKKFIQNVISLL